MIGRTLSDAYTMLDNTPYDENGCKVWVGTSTSKGYAALTFDGGIFRRLNRVVLARKLGRPVVEGMFALHTCDNRMCVAEDHIYEGTPSQNVRDMTDRNRHVSGWLRHHRNNWPVKVGSEHGMARLTERGVIAIRRISSLGYSTRCIAGVFGVSQSTVCKIIRRDTWSHV